MAGIGASQDCGARRKIETGIEESERVLYAERRGNFGIDLHQTDGNGVTVPEKPLGPCDGLAAIAGLLGELVKAVRVALALGLGGGMVDRKRVGVVRAFLSNDGLDGIGVDHVSTARG